jgi:hypothetical protein
MINDSVNDPVDVGCATGVSVIRVPVWEEDLEMNLANFFI